MIKGVNRQVVEITQPDGEYFERIMFFVKPEYAEISDGSLRERAALIVSGTGAPPPTRKRKSKLLAALRLAAAALSGAAVCGTLMSLI